MCKLNLITPIKLAHTLSLSLTHSLTQGSDIVMRILHKKELGCCATSAAVLKEEESHVNSNTRKDTAFWELLGGKKSVKGKEGKREESEPIDVLLWV